MLTDTLPLHLPSLVGVACVVLMGHLLFLELLPRLPVKDRVVLVAEIVWHWLFWTSLVSFVAGLVQKYAGFTPSSAVWLGSGLLSTVLAWDYLCYRWFGVHIQETIPVLLWNFRQEAQVMARPLRYVMIAAACYPVLFGVGLAILHRFYPHRASATVGIPVWLAPVAAALASIVLAVVPRLLPAVMSSAGLAARRDVLWVAGLWPAPWVRAPGTLFSTESLAFVPLPSEPEVGVLLRGLGGPGRSRPLNVFVFIVDSLRADFCDPETTPNLWRLRQEGLRVERTYASANCSHMSWASILHGALPLYWSVLLHQARPPGAAPLRLLKEAGFSVRVLSSPGLTYFGFGKSAFGTGRALADTYVDMDTMSREGIADDVGHRDTEVMDRVVRSLGPLEPGGRTIHWIWLDAPHINYFWPADFVPPFTPYLAGVGVTLDSIGPQNVELLKNRYRNSVAFIDTLFGRYLSEMSRRGLWESSLVVVTGDHGEEFLEEGRLTHSSALNRQQLEVPIICRLPDAMARQRPPAEPLPLASHTDIMPTILDAAGLGGEAEKLLPGRSLLAPEPVRFAVSAHASAYSPGKLMVHTPGRKLVVQLDHPGKIGGQLYARRLSAVALLDDDYQPCPGPIDPAGAAERFIPLLQRFVRCDRLRQV